MEGVVGCCVQRVTNISERPGEDPDEPGCLFLFFPGFSSSSFFLLLFSFLSFFSCLLAFFFSFFPIYDPVVLDGFVELRKGATAVDSGVMLGFVCVCVCVCVCV